MMYFANICRSQPYILDDSSSSDILFSLSEDVKKVQRLYNFYKKYKSPMMADVSEVDIFKMIRYGRMYTCEITRKDSSVEIIAAAGVKDYLVPVCDQSGAIDVKFVLEAGAMLSPPTGFSLQRKLHAVRLFDSLANESPDLYLSATFGSNRISADNMLRDGVFEEWLPPFRGLTELRQRERIRNGIKDLQIRWFRPTHAGLRDLAKEVCALKEGYIVDRTPMRDGSTCGRFKAGYEFDKPIFDAVEFRLADGSLGAAAMLAKRFLDHDVPDDMIDEFFETPIFK
ncbi:hypothetical protein [Hyphomicrobium zavarzinii]|uniref:hypothetical protein n=1 Tax=Hyphomicrobium zavarzinii TaxID=48292 RepID=UPI0003642B67|nr:hypothetical protein [Hyphomicrobium zavarzinii]